MTPTITNRQARRLVLHLQGLSQPPNQPSDSDTLYDCILQLGFVQVDSIQWVERAHHMILFSRSQRYRPSYLHDQIERQQRLFENYTHDASVIPSEYFVYWKHKFGRSSDRLRERMVRWQGRGFLDHCETLLELIEAQGPVRSRDLEVPKRKRAKAMWQWDDGKAALEFLWRTGELAISARDGFQKVYDLSRRVIPKPHFEATCSEEAFLDWACQSAIERLGFGSPSDIAGYWKLITIAECRAWAKRQLGQSVRQVQVASADGSPPREFLARSDIEDIVADLPRMPPRMRVLSPFDPIARDRKRLAWLFNFDYRIEIYVPEKKRKFGYYVFPLLDSDKIIGRIDMRANRQTDRLEVKRVWLEPGCDWSDARQKRLDQELARQAKFAGVSNIRMPRNAITVRST